ncbi:MAG: hypothetical protein KF688_00080 [Pirellulales bacterium]|nr:hypothetical protein [Pirellulales bacterium]
MNAREKLCSQRGGRPRWRQALLGTLALAALAGSAGIACAGGPIVDTAGFEGFNNGNLAGQQGWVTAGGGASTATVQTAVKLEGDKALRVDRGSFSDDRWAVPVDNYPTGRFVRITWDMRVEQAVGAGFGPFFGVDTYDDDDTLAVIASLGVDAKTGEVQFQLQNSGILTGSGVFTQLGSWNRYDLLLDFQTNSSRSYVNGNFVVQTGFVDLGLGINEFTDADIATFSSSGDTASRMMTGTAYFDNFKVTDGVLGDFDLDGDVDGADLTAWKSAYGAGPGADATGDLKSDGADFLVWQRNYGTSMFPPVSLAASVPEPASGLLLVVAGLAGLRQTRRLRNV